MVAGAATVAGAIVLTAVAWRLGARGRTGAASAALVLLALLLRAFAAADPHLHEWDERYHAVVAKNLKRHPLRPTLYDDPVMPADHREWHSTHVWLHKPPLATWAMAASLAAFGESEPAVRAPSVIVGSLAVLLTVRMGTALFSAPVGLLAGFLHAVHGFLIALASGRQATDHVDALFVALVEAAAAAGALGLVSHAGTARAVAVGALTGLAVLTKWLTAGLAVLLWAVVAVARRGPRAGALLVLAAAAAAAAVAAPWTLYTARAFPVEHAFERAYDLRHLSEAVEGHTGGPGYHFARLPSLFGELAPVALVWHLVVAAQRREARDVLLAAWWLVPYVVFSLAATKMPAYVMVAAPAVFLITARFISFLLALPPATTRLRHLARGLLIVLLIILPVRYSFERVRPFRPRPVPAWRTDLRAIAAGVRAPCVLFGTSRAIEAMFHTPCAAYPFRASPGDRASAAARGYDVLVRDDGTPLEGPGRLVRLDQ
jgi:4-amino-4-deoxy-L-arabinose transferase